MLDPYALFERFVLPNDLTIFAAHWPDRPWQYASVLVHSGADQDPPEQRGLAHYVEHLVSSNTLLPPDKIQSYARDQGGFASLGVTNFKQTAYEFKSPSETRPFKRLLEIYGHMLLTTELTREIEAQRQVILSEFEQEDADPRLYALSLERHRQLFPGYPIGSTTSALGDVESVARLTQVAAQHFHDRHYTPANMSFVTLGGLSLRRVIALIEASAFGAHKPGQRNPRPQPAATHPKPNISDKVVHHADLGRDGEGRKSWQIIAAAVVPGKTSLIAVSLFTSLFAERLTEELRTKRSWTYDVGCSHYDHGYFHELSWRSRGLPLSIQKDVMPVVRRAQRQVGNTAGPLRRLQTQKLTRLKMLDFTGEDVIDSATADVARYDQVRSLAERREMLMGATLSDIRALTDYLEPDRWYTSTLLP